MGDLLIPKEVFPESCLIRAALFLS